MNSLLLLNLTVQFIQLPRVLARGLSNFSSNWSFGDNIVALYHQSYVINLPLFAGFYASETGFRGNRFVCSFFPKLRKRSSVVNSTSFSRFSELRSLSNPQSHRERKLRKGTRDKLSSVSIRSPAFMQTPRVFVRVTNESL